MPDYDILKMTPEQIDHMFEQVAKVHPDTFAEMKQYRNKEYAHVARHISRAFTYRLMKQIKESYTMALFYELYKNDCDSWKIENN